jgi:flagellin-like hook-associated protein FlgL
MSGFVHSASVRQNLLALQSTASLLAKPQNDLATGNKVNSALDNPTEFFTAESLSNRAGDIANLLDGIGNGIQVLQAANTGLASLQALVANAQSIAEQVLQAPTGYHTKSNVTSAPIAGATANNLLGNVTPPAISGETLTIGVTGGGVASNITFGTGAGQVSTLNELNAALAANNLQASINTNGTINIITTNEAASSSIGAIGGTAAGAGRPFNNLTAPPPVADPNLQATRANLVNQYNNLLTQINTTAQDASFNGINLLNGDTLKLVFNETGRSTLSIQGVTFNDAGLGLSNLTVGTDFLDGNSANKVLAQLDSASTALRSEASALGSNLSVVQIRQDFNKNLINVLQTGASNLTLADTNKEAANSQALATRQSIAVSALALTNQSQACVLQLLR